MDTKEIRAKATRFRVGPILKDDERPSNKYDEISRLMTLTEMNGQGRRAEVAVSAAPSAGDYLGRKTEEKRTGRAAKFVGDINGKTLFNSLDPNVRLRIIKKQISIAKVPPHLVEDARAQIELALATTVLEKIASPESLATVISRRFANIVKRDFALAVHLPDEIYQGPKRVKVYGESIDEMHDIMCDTGQRTPEEIVGHDEMSTSSEPDMSLLSKEDLALLMLALDSLSAKLLKFTTFLLAGESPARAGELSGISEQTSISYMRRIRETMRVKSDSLRVKSDGIRAANNAIIEVKKAVG